MSFSGGSISPCHRVVIELVGICWRQLAPPSYYPHALVTLPLLVRHCLFAGHHCHWCPLISQLTFISEGRSPIRHRGRRLVACSSAPTVGPRTTKTQNTQITQNSTTQKGAIVNSATDTLRKPRLRERTDRAWFGRLVRHLARKRRTVWVYSYNS